jgi:hypothetical protein
VLADTKLRQVFAGKPRPLVENSYGFAVDCIRIPGLTADPREGLKGLMRNLFEVRYYFFCCNSVKALRGHNSMIPFFIIFQIHCAEKTDPLMSCGWVGVSDDWFKAIK